MPPKVSTTSKAVVMRDFSSALLTGDSKTTGTNLFQTHRQMHAHTLVHNITHIDTWLSRGSWVSWESNGALQRNSHLKDKVTNHLL